MADERSYEELNPERSGPRWEYAQYYFQDPTTVFFSHRESVWENLSPLDALQSLGDCGFELVGVSTMVVALEGEQHPLSNLDMGVPTGRRSQFLEATRMTSLYVFKRLVDPDEPLDLQSLSTETRNQHKQYFDAWRAFNDATGDHPSVSRFQKVQAFRQQYRPVNRHPYRENG